MTTTVARNTFAKVRLSDGAVIAAGLPVLPPPVRVWIESVGPGAQFNPGGVVPGCAVEHDGFGYFPEVEERADFDPQTHRLGDPAPGVLDTESNRVIYARAAVALTQGELDARAAGIVSARADRAAVLIKGVELAAEAARLAFITGGAGKALTYEAKRKEAEAFEAAAAASSPDLPAISAALYPFAHAEAAGINATADPSAEQVTAVLDVYVARSTAWQAIGAQIEALYQKSILDIATARDAGNSAAMGAAAVVAWPAP